MSLVGHARSRVAACATSAAAVCRALCVCPHILKLCRLARRGQVQGAGEKSALPPAVSSGRPHVAQRCSIIWMRTRFNGLFDTNESRVHSGCQCTCGQYPRAGYSCHQLASKDPGHGCRCSSSLALRICLQPGEFVIACDGDVCVAGMDFAVHVPQNACEPRPAADRPCKGTFSLTATRLRPLNTPSVRRFACM